MKHSKYIMIVFLLSLMSCRSVYTWNAKGPFNKSGPVKQLIVDKNNSTKLFAATENGGVWVLENYTDNSKSWTSITEKLDNLQIRGFDVSKRDPDKMIVGTSSGKMYITYNAGDTWNTLGNFDYKYIRKITIDDVLGTILIINVASQNGLYKLEVRRSGSNPLILTDTITNKEVLDFVIDKYHQNVRYYSVRNKGVFKSIDYGNSWKNILKTGSNNEMIKISQPSKDGKVLFKVDQTVYVGSNSSNRVTQIRFPDRLSLGSDVGYRNHFGGRKGDWDNAVAIDPDDSTKLFVATDNFGFSSDNGLSWKLIKQGHEDVHDIKFIGDDILIANDGGVHKLRKGVSYSFANTNGTLLEPTAINKGLNTFQFYRVAVNGNIAVGNADHNGIQYSENLNNENPSWIRVSSRYGRNGLENDFVYKDIKNRNRYFVLFENRRLLRLKIPFTSGENDLIEHHDSLYRLNPFVRFQSNRNCTVGGTFYANCNQYYNRLNYAINTITQDPRRGSNTMLISSHNSRNNTIDSGNEFYIKISKNADLEPTDANPTWEISHRNGAVPIVSLAYASDNNGKAYALDESGKFLENNNVDAGENWIVKGQMPNSSQTETMRQLIVDQNDVSKLFVISHDKIYKSTNEGVTWTALNFRAPLNSNINSITQHHKNFDTFFIGTSKGVYVTQNRGVSWSFFGETLPKVAIMQLFVEGKYLYAVSFGRGLWRCDLENPKRVFLFSGS